MFLARSETEAARTNHISHYELVLIQYLQGEVGTLHKEYSLERPYEPRAEIPSIIETLSDTLARSPCSRFARVGLLSRGGRGGTEEDVTAG